jgi:hypothetical protein
MYGKVGRMGTGARDIWSLAGSVWRIALNFFASCIFSSSFYHCIWRYSLAFIFPLVSAENDIFFFEPAVLAFFPFGARPRERRKKISFGYVWL